MNQSLNVLLFGITRDIAGKSVVPCALSGNATVSDLLDYLKQEYPPMAGISSLLVAVNGEYAEPATRLAANDEIAIIPPVSGG
ncbi:MoaD/ThiS family protein [Arsenicibacter rosenii]|uniref:Molybdopterin synthase sulfur carrier subunit n=1 Tax=Arsenicibacter rosenii TaxID=1750698 RepID=A0A1S2VLR0_9BACT|nr:MoaD/ThiS family protein [Arsenicibacter rosenii]OIN59701.1 molybdopterin synthase sulfur carrier subunit [Arsenicibacter rosenii]